MRGFFATLLSLLVGLRVFVGSALVSLGGLVEAARAETALEFSHGRI
jgi:hypothetical protein